MSGQSKSQSHANPRVRAYGKARLDIARRARTRQEWDTLWKRPQHGFPFTWGEHWKQCIEYRVDDFAAEVGFFIDILGLPVNAFNEYFAMFTGPEREFFFAITPTFEDQESTPPDALRLQFFVDDVFGIANELEQRGIFFEQYPAPVAEGSTYFVGYFHTPHGICIDLCGMVQPEQLAALGFLEQDAQAEEETVDQPEEVETVYAQEYARPVEQAQVYAGEAAEDEAYDEEDEETEDDFAAEPQPPAPQPLFRRLDIKPDETAPRPPVAQPQTPRAYNPPAHQPKAQPQPRQPAQLQPFKTVQRPAVTPQKPASPARSNNPPPAFNRPAVSPPEKPLEPTYEPVIDEEDDDVPGSPSTASNTPGGNGNGYQAIPYKRNGS